LTFDKNLLSSFKIPQARQYRTPIIKRELTGSGATEDFSTIGTDYKVKFVNTVKPFNPSALL
jgi:hypothetical protein